jgi:hypothetical protein
LYLNGANSEKGKLRIYVKNKKKPFGFENLFTVVKILTIETHYFFTQIKHRIRPFFLNISSDERICINCTSDDTEDELHLLLVCRKYEYNRDKLFI